MPQQVDMNRFCRLHAAFSRIVPRLAAAALLGVSCASAQAADFPTRPLTLVLPYTAGGSTDWLARMVSNALPARIKQPVVVENRPGGGGIIGIEQVTRARPDGHILLMMSSTVAAVPILVKGTSFDPQRDLAPVSLATRDTNLLVVNAAVSARTLAQFIAYAKANSNKINFSGIASSFQSLQVEDFARTIGAPITIIPYPGGAQMMRAILANEVQANISIYATVAPHIKAGTVVALVAIAPRRLPLMPDLPTAKELGFDYELTNFIAFFTTAGTPPDAIALLAKEIGEIVARGEIAKTLREQGIEAVGSGPEELARSLAAEIVYVRRLAKAGGLL